MATRHGEGGERARAFVPAAGHDWALPLYDPLLWLFGLDRLRRPLIEGVGAQATQRVLDVGCGTGTLAVALKRLYPEAVVVGLDPDPKALAIARGKADAAGVRVEFVQGYGDRSQQPAEHYDHVVSSFMFHHLDAETKRATLRESSRVLVPGGHFHLLDFVDLQPKKGLLSRALHAAGGDAVLRGEAQTDLAPLLQEHGLRLLQQEYKPLLVLGTLAHYRARKPAA
ncbi:MAG TPA: class I SAM-dependent methyltransferase [Polyangiales bacterium]